ncbi:MAG: nucleotidyltransferase domain-containing protein [Candidatus Edwardsbacteria bacterium]
MKLKNLTKDEIIKLLQENRDVFKKYGVKRIGLFGSWIVGRQTKKSDVDLLVEFDLNSFGKNFKGLFEAFMELSYCLEILFGRKVDILTPDSVETIRIKKIAEEIKRNVIYV